MCQKKKSLHLQTGLCLYRYLCAFVLQFSLLLKKCLTSDDVAELVGVIFVASGKVGESDYHQAQNGDQYADPLTDQELPPQKRHRKQTSEDDDGSAEHLEAGGARHVEGWKTKGPFL